MHTYIHMQQQKPKTNLNNIKLKTGVPKIESIHFFFLSWSAHGVKRCSVFIRCPKKTTEMNTKCKSGAINR